jgi:hypothetical protein
MPHFSHALGSQTVDVVFRHAVTGNVLSRASFSVEVGTDILHTMAREAVGATSVQQSVLLLVGMNELPQCGSLADALGHNADWTIPISIDVVQRNGLDLVVSHLPRNEMAFTNRVFVHTADFERLLHLQHDSPARQCNDNEAHVQIGKHLFSVDIDDTVPDGCVAMSKLQREFVTASVGDQVFVSHVQANVAQTLQSCSFYVDVLGGGYVAPQLRERVRINPEELQRAVIQACEWQFLSSEQKLVVRPSWHGPVLALSAFGLVVADGAERASTSGAIQPDTEITFVSGDSDSVRLVTA